MSVTITVRNVPDDVRDVLAARAASTGRSLQECLSFELHCIAATPSAAEVILQARVSTQTYPALSMSEILDTVHESRR